jgi:magnesium chelatase subunit D
VVTDGRATAGPAPLPQARRAAQLLAADRVDAVVVDCETGPVRLGLAADLAAHLGAEHLPLGEVTAEGLAAAAAGTARRSTRPRSVA